MFADVGKQTVLSRIYIKDRNENLHEESSGFGLFQHPYTLRCVLVGVCAAVSVETDT